LIVVADAGLLSKNNIDQLTNHQYEFILGARIKSETKELKSQGLSENWDNVAGCFGSYKTDINFDGQVDNKDKVEKWLPNVGKGSLVPE